MGAALSAITAEDARGYFEHAGYHPMRPTTVKRAVTTAIEVGFDALARSGLRISPNHGAFGPDWVPNAPLRLTHCDTDQASGACDPWTAVPTTK